MIVQCASTKYAFLAVIIHHATAAMPINTDAILQTTLDKSKELATIRFRKFTEPLSSMRSFISRCFFVLVFLTNQCFGKTGSDKEPVEVKFEAQGNTSDQILMQLTSGKEAKEKRDIYFYDTPQLALAQHHIILRSRKTTLGDDPDDSTVKLRGDIANNVSDDWLHLEGAESKREFDMVVDKPKVPSISITVAQHSGEIDDVKNGKRSVEKLFSRDQERFLRKYAGDTLEWGNLKPMGPVKAEIWKLRQPNGMDLNLTIERWNVDGKLFLEISTRADPKEADRVAISLKDFAKSKGIKESDDPETKTNFVLSHFAQKP
jgi:adenylate cyclase class IV